MADRRTIGFLRPLLSLLPRRLRFSIIRNKLKISYKLDSNFTFRIARTQEELSEAYRILHDSYLEMGYSKPHISGMRIVKYFALPTTTTLIALYDNAVVGTISIVRRGSFGLPMDSAFNLSEFVERNEVIAEVSSLAIDSRFRQNRGALFLPLLKFFWEYVEQFMSLDSIVITVNPAMSDFYEGFLGFSRLKHAVVTDYSFANGNPGIGLYLNIKKAPSLFFSMYAKKPLKKNLYHYFVDYKLTHFNLPERIFKKSSDPVMTPLMLEYFFIKRSRVFSELTIQEKLGLVAAYPRIAYRNVLPQILRENIRHSVNLKARSSDNLNLELTVLDISLNGLCVTSNVKLIGSVSLQIEVANHLLSFVHGEVCWKDLDRNIFGLLLIETDDNWKDFVSYMSDEFQGLSLKDTKKIA